MHDEPDQSPTPKVWIRAILSRETIVAVVVTTVCILFFEPALTAIKEPLLRTLSQLPSKLVDEWYRSVHSDIYGFGIFVCEAAVFQFIVMNAISMVRRAFEIEGLRRVEAQPNKTTKRQMLDNPKVRGLALIYMILAALYLILASIFLLLGQYVGIQGRQTYISYTEAISPVVSDAEMKQFRADWILISGRDDYEKLLGKIERLAAERHAKLPKRLL